MGADTTADDELSIDEIRSALHQLRTVVEELRAENARLTDENNGLRAALASKTGGGGGSGAGENPCDQLRKKAEEHRAGKRRRAAARAATLPLVRKRGKRSPRQPFVAEETLVRDVPASELPADARPNGFIRRHFYGVGIVRHNVVILLREYISATGGRIGLQAPRGMER